MRYLLLLLLLGAFGCDTSVPSPDDLSGRWLGQVKVDIHATLGGAAVIVSNRFDLDVSLTQRADSVHGSGTMRRDQEGAGPVAFRVAGPLHPSCAAGDCADLDLAFLFAGPAPLDDFHVLFDVTEDGREMAGVPCCPLTIAAGSVRLER